MRSIEIPDFIYKALEREAKLTGKSIVDILVERILDALSKDERIEVYRRLHEDYLKKAEECEEKGDFVQAGEKYWRR
ncbi:MAG: hypothetical protein DRZ82_09830 [Thermoprotei archaeon]|nr:MAG: hypothetical protein DRZ82_09830 [Thermoprotei archaeon]